MAAVGMSMAYAIKQSSGWGYVKMRFVFEDGGASWRKLDKQGVGAAFGVPIDTAGLCTTARTPSTRKTIPHVFGGGYRLAVSEQVRAAVERLQLGVHQFLPFDFTMGDGRKPDGYFLLNICSLVDAVDGERSNMRFENGCYWAHGMGPSNPARLVIKRERVAGLAWWMDKRIFGSDFISDELHRVMVRLKVRSMDFWHADEA